MATPKPKVVIVGGGFGGLEAAKALKRADVDVTLVDRSNHHLFQPLLYQVAMAGLSPAEIAIPIRSVLTRQKNALVLLGEVVNVDRDGKRVMLQDGRALPYDHLILAAGARTSYFGHDDWAANAPGLKTVDDAVEIRRRVLLAFERAELEEEAAARRRLLQFVVIGGGPTGVELAGALAELARRVLARDFVRVKAEDCQVLLLEGGPRILSAFDERLSARAVQQLEELGVKVRTGAQVAAIEPHRVVLGGGEIIESPCIIWAAGVAAEGLGKKLGLPTDRAGRVQITPELTVPGHPEIYVIGDLAALTQDGKPLPGTSPVAMQMGRHAARSIRRRLAGLEVEPFRYFDKGNMATIGRSRAIAEVRGLRLSGFLAWMAWLVVHIWYLVGFKNRVFVLLQWIFAYVVYRRGARLITRGTGA